MNIEQDSSSSDENDLKLREALDLDMFSVGKSISGNKEYKEGRKLGRYKDQIPNVTAGFQNFVAKRLSDTLDRIIKERVPKKHRYELDPSAGIRLFTDSKTLLKDRKFLDTCKDCTIEPKISVQMRKQKSKRKMSGTLAESDESELDEIQKCRNAAVSAEWILSGECIKGWSETKGDVFSYRRNEDGILEAKESSFNFLSSRKRLD